MTDGTIYSLLKFKCLILCMESLFYLFICDKHIDTAAHTSVQLNISIPSHELTTDYTPITS